MEFIPPELQECMWRVWLPCDPSVSTARISPSSSGFPWELGSDPPGAAQQSCPSGLQHHVLSRVLSEIWRMLGQIPSPGTGISSSQVDCGWCPVSWHLQLLRLQSFHLQSSSSFPSSHQILHLWEYGFPTERNFLISLVSLTEVFSFEDQLPASLKHSKSVSLKLCAF